MHESDDELAALQAALDASASRSGDHLRTAFARDRWISARDLARELSGIFEVHLAALSGSGAPLVAPVDAILFKGRVWVALPGASLRSKLLRRDPRVSVSFARGDLALIVHGTFQEVSPSEAEAAGYSELVRDLYIDVYGDWFGRLARSEAAEPELRSDRLRGATCHVRQALTPAHISTVHAAGCPEPRPQIARPLGIRVRGEHEKFRPRCRANGPPRSGKSTIAAAIQAGPDAWMNLGVDLVSHGDAASVAAGIGLRPGGERPEREDFVTSYLALFDSVGAHASRGLNVVVDVGHHDWYTRPRRILERVAPSLRCWDET